MFYSFLSRFFLEKCDKILPNSATVIHALGFHLFVCRVKACFLADPEGCFYNVLVLKYDRLRALLVDLSKIIVSSAVHIK